MDINNNLRTKKKVLNPINNNKFFKKNKMISIYENNFDKSNENDRYKVNSDIEEAKRDILKKLNLKMLNENKNENVNENFNEALWNIRNNKKSEKENNKFTWDNLTNKNVNNDEGKEIEKKLKEELNKLKLENERLKNKLGEKEKKVQNLKEYTNKVPEITKKGNFEEEIKQFNLEGILTESDVDLNDNNIENKEEKKIRNEIKSALNKNESKQNEIDETKKYYNNLVIQKDGIINALESQIKPSLQKDNNYMNKGNMNNNINNKEINSIKELNLDYENMLQNNNPNIQPQEQEIYEDNMDNNDYENMNEEEMEEFQYNPEGEEQYGNDEIHDLGDIGENEGEEGYEEYQNPNYEYNPQYQNEEENNDNKEGERKSTIKNRNEKCEDIIKINNTDEIIEENKKPDELENINSNTNKKINERNNNISKELQDNCIDSIKGEKLINSHLNEINNKPFEEFSNSEIKNNSPIVQKNYDMDEADIIKENKFENNEDKNKEFLDKNENKDKKSSNTKKI